MVDTNTDLPSRLRANRLRKGLSQAELASRVGIVQTAISQFETGVKSPRLDTLVKLASALEISTAMLIGEEEPSDES